VLTFPLEDCSVFGNFVITLTLVEQTYSFVDMLPLWIRCIFFICDPSGADVCFVDMYTSEAGVGFFFRYATLIDQV